MMTEGTTGSTAPRRQLGRYLRDLRNRSPADGAGGRHGAGTRLVALPSLPRSPETG